jgi:hypothetical protein
MDTKKYKILILYFVFFSLIYANDNTGQMSGVWIQKSAENNIMYAASVTKLNENEYFVIYTSNFEKRVLDFSAIEYRKGDKIYIKINAEREFYLILKKGVDKKHDILYVLWNHDFPDAVFGDVPLQKVEYLYDEILQQKETRQKEKNYEDSLREWIIRS